MVPPLLKLAFVQGPRDGESVEYKPGSTIRIGRIVRGNEIAVKDAGISTKHLRIVSDSEKWIIHDLGSSNGTVLNSETLEPDAPVNLSHGDVIKLGECTSIVVNLETDCVEAEEPKLPPRPRRNNRRLPVSDPDPVPTESVQEKPARKGRSAKQEEVEPPKRGRATRSKKAEEVGENEKEAEVKPRVGRPRKKEKKVAITSEEEDEEEEEAVLVEKKGGNSRARGGKTNTEDSQDLGLNSVKLEVEDTPKAVEVKRATRSRQNVGSSALEEMRRPSRATRSQKKEIGGDSFLELEMVLNQARKSRANKKNMDSKPEEEEEEEDKVNEKDVEAQKCRSESSDKEDETSRRVEQVETESRKSTIVREEEYLNCTSVREDGETENSQVDEERDSKSDEAGIETSDGGCDEEKAEQEPTNDKNVDKVEVELEKMTLGEWFSFMEVHLRKQIVEETEKMIQPMTSKSFRVHQHIAEHKKQAKGKGSVS